MYQTKHKVHSKTDLGLLSIHTGGAKNKGDPFNKPRSKNPADDRYKGKQFSVPKKCEVFSKFPFALKGKNDPYNEKISFLKLERRNGFGSSDPVKRDEFSHTIAINKHRESIKSEKKFAKLFEIRHKTADSEKKKVRFEEEDEIESNEPKYCEYDQVFGLTPDDDTIGKATTVERLGKRHRRWKSKNPLMKTTSTEYGTDATKYMKKYSKFARTKSTEQLFDKGHLHIECH